jgi:signal transduction histidine kinase
MNRNPLRLAEDRILVEQLRLVMGNVGSSVIPAFLVALLMLHVLAKPDNQLKLRLWCAVVILSKLGCYLHARYYLHKGIAFQKARPLVTALMALHAVDAGIWATLCWVTLDTATMTARSLVFAVLTGIAGSSMSLLAPVFPLFVSFILVEVMVVSSKLFLMGDGAYDALGLASMLYGVALIGQAHNSALASRVAVVLRFELADSHARLREIAHRQTLIDERQRLMQDMHDGMGSSLLTALLAVERGRIDASTVAEVLKGCIDDLKLAIDSMEPVQADLLLLLATLRFRLGPRLESAGIALRWEVETVPDLDWIDPRNALHILRILQEAFTNIVKHTRATEIRVSTGVDNDHVVVTVADNGEGFSVAQGIASTGKGLGNQIHRAESIGAEVRWNSSEAGTCLNLYLPIKRLAGERNKPGATLGRHF